jgi:hypothetical protein
MPLLFHKKKLNRRGRGARRGGNGQILIAGMQGEKRRSFSAFPEGQNGPGAFQERSLRSLLPLRSSSCLDPPKTERQRGVYIHKSIFVFFSLPRKSSAISVCSAVDFFFLLGGRREFSNF